MGAGRGLPIGLSLFQLWGCPASSLLRILLFSSSATRCRYDVPGVLVSGSGLAASA